VTTPRRGANRLARVTAALASSFVALAVTAACSSSKPKSTPASGSPTGSATATRDSSPPASAPPSGAAGITACSLATNADVKSVYGEDFGAAQASTPGGYSTCLFPPPTGGIDEVSFTVATGAQAQLFYTTNQSVYIGKAVAQLGDKAFVSDDGGAIGVLAGNTAFLVHLIGFEKVPPPTLQTMQENFAKLLLSRLH